VDGVVFDFMSRCSGRLRDQSNSLIARSFGIVGDFWVEPGSSTALADEFVDGTSQDGFSKGALQESALAVTLFR
jgi:hypothetical protein